jgi:phenylacetate-CoA ligase
MALTNLVAYRGAYTTAIVVAYLQEAGCVRVNLRDEDWRLLHDRQVYLERWHSDVVLGDPVALSALECVRLPQPPRVLVSSVMSLSDGLTSQLVARYGSPVLDLYALTEAGIVAVKTAGGHRVLPHDLYVEILDENDEPCPAGCRGEVTLTGGRNPFLPLLRYRTGDFAALAWQDGQALLIGLEGRQPVAFATSSGRVIHSMEITRALRPLQLVQFHLWQDAQGHFDFGYRGAVDPDQLRSLLLDVLGPSTSLEITTIAPHSTPRKIHQYLSHCASPLAEAQRR